MINKNIDNMSEIELKALAYECVVGVQNLQNDLNTINLALNKKMQEGKKEVIKK